MAIPHIVIEGRKIFKILLVRAKTGIIFPKDQVVHVIFVLVGSSDERNLHLKVLSAIAQITQDEKFFDKWFQAANKEDLKNIILLAERKRFLKKITFFLPCQVLKAKQVDFFPLKGNVK